MKKGNLMLVLVCLVASILQSSCQKEELKSGSSARGKAFVGNTYEYLKSKPGFFDSLLYVIDRLKLDSALKHDTITLFAVTNASFKLASEDLNAQRLRTGKKPIYLRDYSLNQLDSLMCRYITKGHYSSKRLNVLNGLNVFGYKYGYELNAKATVSSAVGQTGAGPSSIVYSSKNRTEFKNRWTSVMAFSVDIPTANGLVHIVDDQYAFGFGYYSKQPSGPFRDRPFLLPIVLNENSERLEAENFDTGGPGVAYHDAISPANEIDSRKWNASSQNGTYRLEGVDIWAQGYTFNKGVYFPAGFRIGQMWAGEWTNYSIEVPEDGDYEIKIHYYVSNSIGSPSAYCDLRLDWKILANRVTLPVTGGLMTEIKAGTYHLTKGNHYLTFCTLTSVPDLAFDAFVFKRVN
jgi:hypothetical protein